jgi:uncharacterized protein (DUF1499 family)
MSEGRWGTRLAKAALWTGLGGILAGALGAFGTGWGLWPFTTGFMILGAGLILCILGLLTGLGALFANRGRAGQGRNTAIGLITSLVFLGIMGLQVSRGAGVPAIHDITTDLANPPAFAKLPLRADNLAGLKGGMEEWRTLHAKAYGDIKPLMLPNAPADVAAAAKALLAKRGWEVALDSPDRIEATATTAIFRFKDDVLILIRAEGAGTRVDMRSVSRVGVSDLGANGKRVREFLADLSASVSGKGS